MPRDTRRHSFAVLLINACDQRIGHEHHARVHSHDVIGVRQVGDPSITRRLEVASLERGLSDVADC